MQTSVQEIASSSAQPELRPRRGSFRPYILALSILVLILYFIPFLLLRVPGSAQYTGSELSPALDYSFTTKGQDADIVIFGDSSAFYGISPNQMSKALGMKVINLPITGPSLPVINDLPLRYYLSVNRAPKLIVFYFSPWNLDYHNEHNPRLFEGEEVLLRHGNFAELKDFALQHPGQLLQYPFQVYSLAPKTALMNKIRHEDRFKVVAANHGHIDSPEFSAGGRKTFPNLNSSCVIPSNFLNKPTDSVRSLIGKYKGKGSGILTFLAPVPACQNISSIINRDYSDVPAARPNVLPPSAYKDDTLFIHPAATAVPEVTKALTTAVRQALAQPIQ